MTTHEPFMRICLQLAEQAMQKGNEPFGAILVCNGEILLTAENTIHTEHDVTRHAELNLISQACRQFEAKTLAKCWLYTSTEPCAMCSGAIHWANLAGVVFGCFGEDLAKIADDEPGYFPACIDIFARSTHPMPTIGPILQEEALALHQRYWP